MPGTTPVPREALALHQVERVEALREPAADRRKKVMPRRARPDRARAAQGLSRREVRRSDLLHADDANACSKWRRRIGMCTRATAIRFHPQSINFTSNHRSLTPPQGPSLHQCSAAPGQIAAVPQRRFQRASTKRGQKLLPFDLNRRPAIAGLKGRYGVEGGPVKRTRQPALNQPLITPSRTVPFFICRCGKFFGLRVSYISAKRVNNRVYVRRASALLRSNSRAARRSRCHERLRVKP